MICTRSKGDWSMRTLFLLIACTLSGIASAAAQTIFGSSTAEACYQVAVMDSRLTDVGPCDDAIKTGDLTRVDLAATYSNRGIILANSGQLERATADHNIAVQLDPLSARAYINRANTLFRARRYAEALADYDRAIELSAGAFAVAYYNRSFVHLALAHKDQARKDLEQAAALAPGVQTYQDALKSTN
jgi:tetratricopeptide (TPR) repeat protein